jgi:hypothetical protein
MDIYLFFIQTINFGNRPCRCFHGTRRTYLWSLNAGITQTTLGLCLIDCWIGREILP